MKKSIHTTERDVIFATVQAGHLYIQMRKIGDFCSGRNPRFSLLVAPAPKPLFRRLASAATHRSGAFSKTHCQAIAANFFKISLSHCHSFSCQRSISSSADTQKWSKVSRLDFPFSELISTPSCRQRQQRFGGGQFDPHHLNGA